MGGITGKIHTHTHKHRESNRRRREEKLGNGCGRDTRMKWTIKAMGDGGDMEENSHKATNTL